MTNIALVGRMGSGKSTVAELLVKHGYSRHSWADPVRAIFAMAYGGELTGSGYIDTKARNYPVEVAGRVGVLRSGRELLQRIGTDAMRENVDLDFWVKAGAKKAASLVNEGKLVVNDDTRFTNEADALRAMGFTIVRVARPGFNPNSGHASETEQEAIKADLVINNAGSIDDLHEDVLIQLGLTTTFSPWQASHEVVSEGWGDGDGEVFRLLGDRYVNAGVENRGVWPPDTRVAGLLTCCGSTQHTLACPQWR